MSTMVLTGMELVKFNKHARLPQLTRESNVQWDLVLADRIILLRDESIIQLMVRENDFKGREQSERRHERLDPARLFLRASI